MLASAAIIFAFAASRVPWAMAAQNDAEEKPLTPAQKEIVAAIDNYNKALSQKDLKRCMAAFVPGEDTMVMGTGPGETWRGPEEIRFAHENFFKSIENESVEPVWRQIQASGDFAWVAAQSHHVDAKDGRKREFVLNVSAVLQKKGGQWLIALIHFSNVVGPEGQQ